MSLSLSGTISIGSEYWTCPYGEWCELTCCHQQVGICRNRFWGTGYRGCATPWSHVKRGPGGGLTARGAEPELSAGRTWKAPCVSSNQGSAEDVNYVRGVFFLHICVFSKTIKINLHKNGFFCRFLCRKYSSVQVTLLSNRIFSPQCTVQVACILHVYQ